MIYYTPANTPPKHNTKALVTGFDFGDNTKDRHYVVAWYTADNGWIDEDGGELSFVTHYCPITPPTDE